MCRPQDGIESPDVRPSAVPPVNFRIPRADKAWRCFARKRGRQPTLGEALTQEERDIENVAEETLAASVQATHANYRAIVEHIPAITYTDVLGDGPACTYISPQVEALLGVTPGEWIADAGLWFALLHPEDRDRARAEYRRGRDSGRNFALEYRMLARSGRVVWFRDEAVVVRDADGRPHVVQGLMLDITKRKEAEEQEAASAFHDKLTGLPNRAMFQ